MILTVRCTDWPCFDDLHASSKPKPAVRAQGAPMHCLGYSCDLTKHIKPRSRMALADPCMRMTQAHITYEYA